MGAGLQRARAAARATRIKSADCLPADFGKIDGEDHPDTVISNASWNAALQAAADIALAIDSGRGNEKEIARGILNLKIPTQTLTQK